MSSSSLSFLAPSTVAMMLLFGTNACLFALLRYHKYIQDKANAADDTTAVSNGTDKHQKVLSKPFEWTIDSCLHLSSELFLTGMIMLFTYICENHWFYGHSEKEYDRDLFLFIVLVFFIYGFYTIRPHHDLTLLNREQSEEWKGWMQFIFLLYHYFHAEDVYNAVVSYIYIYIYIYILLLVFIYLF